MQYWKHRWHALLAFWQRLYPSGPLLLLLALLFIGLGAAILSPVLYSQQQQLAQAQQLQQQLQQQQLQADQQRVTLQLELKLEQQSQHETQAALVRQRQQLDDVQTELAFYRNIMAPEQEVDGVVVHDLVLDETNTPRRFRYQLVLTQQQLRKRYGKGSVSVQLEGTQAGKAQRLSLLALGGDSAKFDYSFRYFQQFDGEISVPENFIPERVLITLKSRGKGGNSETLFPFSQLVSADTLRKLQGKT
ncbi:DUF6776 family protein [uncultured Ferrimonas sp.]|uniref:DUF6776 family protein n=1 Tax=uncultured Ferrimonas sp. TaxID=432640 RepID=UPI00263866C5|nr:DUF6776 family protein [uncultured Ferrimonas sp.]